MPNTPQTGKSTVNLWTPAGGSQIALSDYGRDINIDEKAKKNDTTTYAEALLGAETSIPGPTDGTLKMDVMYQVGDTTTFNALAVGTTGAMEHRREGTGSGKPKENFSAWVMSRGRPAPYGDVMVMSVEFQITGVITYAAQ